MNRIMTISSICVLAHLSFAQNFGIGTSSPGAKLDVSGVGDPHNGVLTEHIRLSADPSHYSSIKTSFSNTAAANKLTFSVDQEHSLGTIDVMTLQGDGNVGIGTINPTLRLEVTGSIKAESADLQISGVTCATTRDQFPPGISYFVPGTSDANCPYQYGTIMTINSRSCRTAQIFYGKNSAGVWYRGENCGPWGAWKRLDN